jgi:hypothetical protein
MVCGPAFFRPKMSHALLRLEDASMEQLIEQIRQIRGRSDSTLLTYPELLKVLLC